MEGGKNANFLRAIWKLYRNVKIPRPSSEVRYSPDNKRGEEPVPARRSECCVPIRRPQGEAETGSKLNKKAGKPDQTCTGPMLAVPEHHLSLGSTEKARRRREWKAKDEPKEGESSTCLPVETCFPLLSVLFPSHGTKLAASRLDHCLLLAICVSLLCLSQIFPRAGSISACIQPNRTAAQRLRIEECSQTENRASSELLFFFFWATKKNVSVWTCYIYLYKWIGKSAALGAVIIPMYLFL